MIPMWSPLLQAILLYTVDNILLSISLSFLTEEHQDSQRMKTVHAKQKGYRYNQH
jgi:hypothetical protein